MARVSTLGINMKDLLNRHRVEGQRIEFKKAWHNQKESGPRGTFWQVLHTICAFANDFYNDNGGYIIIGVEDKQAPEDSEDNNNDVQKFHLPCGVPKNDLDTIEREIDGACKAYIKPEFHPKLSHEVVEHQGETRHLLVIWARVSDNRPHTCKESEKKEHCCYIRRSNQTIKADHSHEIELRSRNSPFDDRRTLNLDLTADDIDLNLVKKYLREAGSTLAEDNDLDPIDLYRNLELVTYDRDVSSGGRLTSVYGPRNVALLLFHPNPHLYFRGAQTEIGIYSSHDRPLEEKKIRGPIDQQIEEVLSYISTSTEEEARHEYIAYPRKALREAIVNAFHHRSYEASASDPIKIHLKPDSIEIISYPGPDPTLTENDFNGKKNVPPVPSRNRRITNFLKDKKLAEGRFSGVKTIYRAMKSNANSEPVFDFRSTYFRVTLPGHPKYIAYSVIRDVETYWAKGDKQDAINLLKEFLDDHLTEKPSFLGPELSERLVCKQIELHENDVSHQVLEPYLNYISEKHQRCIPLAEELKKWCDKYQTGDVSTGVTIIKELVNKGAEYEQLTPAVKKAVDLLNKKDSNGKRMESAVQDAHKLFEEMGDEVTRTYSHVAYHFAFCKYNLYEMQANSRQSRINLLDFLDETEEYADIALRLTNQEHKRYLAKEYLLLGYIHAQKLIIKKSTEEKVRYYYTKARKFDPSIKINRTLIPSALRGEFRP